MSKGLAPDNDIERVREAVDIVRLIGEHLVLKPRGREYVGLCPFHDDHRPSMNVVPGKGIFHCFVCGAGGDCFGFVKRYHGMEFREALEYLAEKHGITLTRHARAPESSEGPSKADLLRACATARDFFRVILNHPEHGRAGRDIIARRGITPAMIDAFQIGAAPDRWDGLVQTIASKGFGQGAFVGAGLLKRRESGDGAYDALRNRLIFPIHDQMGRVVAFGGRKINEADEPKYLNSPETRVFDKSATLYGLHQASKSIITSRVAIVTEGYTDAIACHQAGVTNVVATLGTALTRQHAAMLRRLCDTVVLLFDADDAGRRAADRAFDTLFRDVLVAHPLDVRVASIGGFTDAKDPDELLKRPEGADVLRRALDAGVPLVAFRFERLRAGLTGAGPGALARAMEAEIAHLVALGLNELDPIRRPLVLRELALAARIPEEELRGMVPAGRKGRWRAPAAESGDVQAITSGPLTAHERLLGCLLCEPALDSELPATERAWFAGADAGAYAHPLLHMVASTVHEMTSARARPDLGQVVSFLEGSDAGAAAVALAERLARETDHQPDRLRTLWQDTLMAARRDATRLEDPAPGTEDLNRRLERTLKMHQTLGADRRKLHRL